MTLHTYTSPQPMFLPSFNFLNLMISEIQEDKLFPAACPPARLPTQPPTHLDAIDENNTRRALKGCGVKR